MFRILFPDMGTTLFLQACEWALSPGSISLTRFTSAGSGNLGWDGALRISSCCPLLLLPNHSSSWAPCQPGLSGLAGTRCRSVTCTGPGMAWLMHGPLRSCISAIWELVSSFISRMFLVFSSIFSFIRRMLVHLTYMFLNFSFILSLFQFFLLL